MLLFVFFVIIIISFQWAILYLNDMVYPRIWLAPVFSGLKIWGSFTNQISSSKKFYNIVKMKQFQQIFLDIQDKSKQPRFSSGITKVDKEEKVYQTSWVWLIQPVE